ncbi:uncharacterized protein LOC114758546 [Neltuma alba]|uniref:uncharacterized protein LOC114758546 n=1 Tax=Neltuma alba TaxID=207710 RepID=UPI0010A3CD15|nr:uncharacterized protein LOC114758546 [Prosopis alba]
MYVTRPRSLYKRDPEALWHPPQEGPNSGYLVLQDEQSETHSCFGLCNNGISNLPLPQNKNLSVLYIYNTGELEGASKDELMFIPVLNQPLSSNLYYAIRRKGKHQGEASTCTKEDICTCLFFSYSKHIQSRPFNPSDEYQQFEILKKSCGFQAKPIVSDGLPPLFVRKKNWILSSKTPHSYQMSEALGINPSLRTQLPPFTFPSSLSSSDRSEPVVAGKWYCPFMFVKEEGVSVKEQMKRSVFYEMTLERRWDRVLSKENSGNSNEVFVDVVAKTEVARLGDGREAVWEEGRVGEEGVMWLRSLVRGERKVGLSMAIVERIRWEEERSDWEGKNEKKQARFKRVEKFEGISGMWRNFGFYVLVESFVLKRMDGSLVLTCDFRHSNHVKCTWEETSPYNIMQSYI